MRANTILDQFKNSHTRSSSLSPVTARNEMEYNVLIVGDPFFGSGGTKRCIEVISRYKKYGIKPHLVIPPLRLFDKDIKRILPRLIASGVRIIGLDLSVKFGFRKRNYNSAWLLDFRESSALCSHLVHELLGILRKIKFHFVIGHHELPDVIQMTHEIAEKLELPSAIVLQLPPFYENLEKAVRLTLLDGFNLSLAPKFRSLLPDYYRSIYSGLPNRGTVRDIIREPLWIVPILSYLKSRVSKHLNSIDNIFAVSKSIPCEMGEKWLPKVRVLQPGVATDEILTKNHGKQGEKNHILYYARLTPTKGVLEVPLIWKAFLRHSGERYNLHIAGRFENHQTEEIFKTLVNRLGVERSIKYLGYLDRPSLINNIACAKVILYPSHLDSVSLVVLESLALGVPVIAYNIPAIRMNYSKSDGVEMVDEFDISGIAGKLRQSIQSPFTIKEMTQHSWDQVVASEIEFAKNLC
jgi:glycosyltransferase involved in cell wall biosynthesis